MLLKKGIESPDVQNLEHALQGLGFTGFIADGIFDQKTENVIRYIQKAHKLKVDGVVGRNTLELIDRLYEPETANFAPRETELPAPVVKSDGRKISKEDNELEKVHPILTAQILDVKEMAREEGYHVTVVQGLRTFAEQDKLFKQRPRVTKAKGGQSYHNYGVAVDLAFIDPKTDKLTWEEKLYRNIGRWAGQAGLTWGGNWRFVDYPHLQLPNLPPTGRLLDAYAHGGIPEVWRRYVN